MHDSVWQVATGNKDPEILKPCHWEVNILPPFDLESGACVCVDATVTGRDCSQCGSSRAILAPLVRGDQRAGGSRGGASCRNCDDGCVGELLDDVDGIVGFFEEADVSDIDPAPMLRLIDFRDTKVDLRRQVDKTGRAKDRF